MVVALVFGLAVGLGVVAGVPRLAVATVAFVGWVYYVGVTAWLMEGQSAGKVIYGLNLRRIRTGSVPHTVRGLVWFVGRQTVGYVLVDVFLVGALLTLVDRRRRCLHDHAFASEVVQAPGVQQVRGSFVERHRSYWELFHDRYDQLNQRNRWFFFPWKLLTKAMYPAVFVVDKLWSAKAGAAVAPAEAAKPLSAKAAAALCATTTVAAGAIVVAVARPSDPDPVDLAGTWQLSQVESASQGAFATTDLEGTLLTFERVDDTFRVVAGPDPMLNAELSPTTVDDRDALARFEDTYQSDCVDLTSGVLVAPEAYAMTATWEFTRTELTGDDDRPDHLGLHFVQVGERDTDDPTAATCQETTRYEVSGTAERVATAQP
jgi:uncharacterized RDD family membrane protein YckC